jgi:hypothetical protein
MVGKWEKEKDANESALGLQRSKGRSRLIDGIEQVMNGLGTLMVVRERRPLSV